jgi:ribonucleoside-diphosphate reductase alpha chain
VEAPEAKGFDGTLDEAEAAGIPIKSHKTVRARELFGKIVRQAHHNGEPGLLFLDAANRSNPVPHLYELEATNPCGEQWLGPYENCCLGSINLAQHFGPDGTVDWEKLQETVELSTCFLDDVVEGNAYVPAVPELKEAAYRARRIGLGIMGLADLMYHAGIRYGSEEGQEFVAQVMEFVRYHSMQTSIELAEQRGPFLAIEGSIYDPENMTWQPPQPLQPHANDFGRPNIDWDQVVKGIEKHGIRNAAQTTIAPTGTIATVSGCEGYGCEPVFALAYIRHVNDNGKDLQLTYTSPLFEQALVNAGLDNATREKIVERVVAQGTCQGVEDLPKEIAGVFVVSADISAEEHVRMQAALQAFVDNSLSKTINFPADASEKDVATAYQLAWRLGAKGITVYVTGSREKVVLETHATAGEKKDDKKEPQRLQTKPSFVWNETKKPRPQVLHGHTYHIDTPVGKAFVTINENGGSQPFEAFLTTAKAGSEIAALSESIGRLISYVLRLSSPVAPRERLKEIYRQLSGIGGGRPLGFGPNRVLSLPDGVARALGAYLDDTAAENEPKLLHQNGGNGNGVEIMNTESVESQPARLVGDICPECGHASLINEEGCRKCYSCAYSEC